MSGAFSSETPSFEADTMRNRAQGKPWRSAFPRLVTDLIPLGRRSVPRKTSRIFGELSGTEREDIKRMARKRD
jgi:hypothetical protein